MQDSERNPLEPNLSPFERLVAIMAVLRSERGCAWDRKQTHQSLLPYLIEEAYEVVEAVESGDSDMLCEELGDLICQVVFHAQMAKEANAFDIDDALKRIGDKLIQRHPHIFGDRKELNPQQVRDQWEKIKVESGEKKSVLAGLPKSMPALLMAYRMGEKAGGVGFDWTDPSEVMDKVLEELDEIRGELAAPQRDRLAEEIGDLLFAVASLSRKLQVDPEHALRVALAKFRDRFSRLEDAVRQSGRSFEDYTLEQLEQIWQRIK
ncbi:MAG: nucleoside triphosphate pyrophosphohydrolase [Candidatus Zixiibacteriota bacterium]|nr:MAG: nucleoside triphosphate pyrophosphohydrolase [candidate division Zixibacteria bacterium]